MAPGNKSDSSTSIEQEPRGKRRRWLIRAAIAVAILVILVALAPTILSLGIGRAWILGAVGDRVGLTLASDGWGLSWFGSQEVRGLSVRLPDGATVATIGRTGLDQGLLSLIRDSEHIGRIRVEQGEVWTDRLARAIDIIQKMPSSRPPSPAEAPRPGQPPTLPSVIELKSIIVHAGAERLNVREAAFLSQPDGDLLTASAEIDSGGARGTAAVKVMLDNLSSNWRGWSAVAARGTVQCKDLPLAPVMAAAADLGLPVQGGGTLSTFDGEFSGSAAGPLALKANLDARSLWATGTPLGDDRPALDNISLTIDGTLDWPTLTVRTLKLDSPVAQADVSGTFSLAVLGGAATGSGKGSVHVELAPLARMLPNTIGLHKDVAVTSGAADATFSGSRTDKLATLSVAANIKDVRGTRGGKAISLEPVTLKATVEEDLPAATHASSGASGDVGGLSASAGGASALTASRTAASPVQCSVMTKLNRLHIKAGELSGPFGTVAAEGRIDDFKFDAALDLAKVSSQVGQFIDLGGATATGSAVAHVKTKGSLDKIVYFSLTSSFKNLKLDLGNSVHIDESQATVAASGSVDFAAAGGEAVVVAAGIETLTLDATGVHAEAGGTTSRAAASATTTLGPWVIHGRAAVNGQVVRLADLAGMIARVAGPAQQQGDAKPGAAPAAKSWADYVAALARYADGPPGGRPATGNLSLTVGADGSLAGDVKVTLQTSLDSVSADLGTAGKPLPWNEAKANLDLAGAVMFTSGQELAGATIDKVTLVSSTGTVAANGAASLKNNAWTWSAQFTGDGEIAPAARLHQLIADLQAGGRPAAELAPVVHAYYPAGAPDKHTPPPYADMPVASPTASQPAGPILSDKLADLLRRAAGVGGEAAQGRWHLDATADGSSDKFIHMLERLTLADVVIPAAASPAASSTGSTAAGSAAPLRIASAIFTADTRYAYGPQPSLTISNLNLTIPGLAADIGGHTALPEGGGSLVFRGKLDVTASADLAVLSQTLAPLGVVPSEPVATGQVNLKMSAASVRDDATLLVLAIDGKNVDISWPDGRRVKEAAIKIEAGPLVSFDAQGSVARIDVQRYMAQVAAGSLTGGATIEPGKNGWSYRVAAEGEGAVEPLAAMVAGIMGKPAGNIRGNWKLARGTFSLGADGSMAVDASAAASDLVIPQSATGTTPAGPDVQLADARATVAATMDKAGAIAVRAADIVGPGIAAKASGTAHLPTDADKTLAADGAVTLKANLAEFVEALRPFGLIPADMKLAGAADFDGKVASNSSGLSGSGTLDVANLDVQIPSEQVSIQDPKLHVPLTVGHKPRERRWDFSADGMTSSLIAGMVRGSYIEADAADGKAGDPQISVVCGISIIADRAQQLVQRWMPANLTLAGGWRIQARAAGPLHMGATSTAAATPTADGPIMNTAPPAPLACNEIIADLVGDGIVEVKRVQYGKIVAGDGTVRWRLADGRLDLNPTPTAPSRLTVAGGTLNLGGVVELRGPVPLLVIAKPLKLVDSIPFSDPGIKEYLKYASPVVGASVNPEGKVTVDIASLNLPLAATEYKKMVGAGSFTVDRFQTELSGPLGTMSQWVLGIPKATPTQTLGPIKVRVAGGEVIIERHTLDLGGGASMEMSGKIGLDEKMNVEVQIPLTQAMLQRFGASAQVAPFLLGQKISVPMTGTIDKPQLDDKVVAKRIGEMVAEAMKRAIEKKATDMLPDILKGLKK